MKDTFEIISKNIEQRRTVKADRMNGKKISEEWMQQITQLADYAPTHGRTEPWRLTIFGGAEFDQFSKDHAEMYRKFHANFKENTYDKLKTYADTASHLVILVMIILKLKFYQTQNILSANLKVLD